MPDIILHHYPRSPFAHKVRGVLGYKKLNWRSAEVPMFPPRPELSLLAGAYRKIPVMQVGADIFCDSNMILRAIDMLHPVPTLYPAGDALSYPISHWFEPRLFSWFSAVRFRTREDLGDLAFASEFRADRAPFMLPMVDIAKNRDNMPTMAAHVRAFAGWLDGLLQAQPFLGGGAPSHADFSAWHPIWWLGPASARTDLLSEFSALWAWEARMSAFGEGASTPISQADALAAAKSARPGFALPNQPGPGDPAPGARVIVTPDDYGCDPVAGDLVFIGLEHVSIHREAPETGDVVQHFPRWGYRVTLA